MTEAPTREQITGLVLAGGRGSRMGGVDKGLQLHQGVPLALHALRRLAPQVGTVMVNANRHLDVYAGFGAPVCPDDVPGYAGPLAGWLAGLRHCTTPWLVSVPCDTPDFPIDLVARLAAGLAAAQADLAMAVAPEPAPDAATDPAADPAIDPAAGGLHWRKQPVFCLLRRSLHDSLQAFVAEGGRKVDRWTALHRVAEVRFDDAAAFFNANTLDELRQLQAPRR
ncbi:MAG: molybdenum cofactor guanylyltransferase MobA [Rubrivivax sp.]|nr:molybdenum cofactor guanylyltransferase MobA [Rubrivivax sp.]